MSNIKYLGTTFEGRWQVVDQVKKENGHYYYILKNIYNEERITLTDEMMRRCYVNPKVFSSYRRYKIQKETKGWREKW